MTKLAFSLLLSALFLGCSSSDDDTTPDPGAQGGAAGSSAAGQGGSDAGSGGSTAGSGGSTAGSGGSGGSAAGSGGSAAGQGGAAGAGGIPLPGNVPDALKVPAAADIVVLKAHGVGVQIYTCTDTAASGGAGGGGGGGGAGGAGGAEFQWVFKEPKADLFDEAKAKIGIHYVGPTWESTDGSKVVGMTLAKASAPSASDIVWLLLQAKSTSGTGVLSSVAYIQRLDTQGGVAPASGCDGAAVGQTTEVNYEANYYFYAPGP